MGVGGRNSAWDQEAGSGALGQTNISKCRGVRASLGIKKQVEEPRCKGPRETMKTLYTERDAMRLGGGKAKGLRGRIMAIDMDRGAI